MSSEIIKVPDIGGDTDVEIIEIAVSVGDVIEAEDTLITLESDKASMDVPAPKGGKVLKVLVKEGDSVSEGDDIIELEVEGSGEEKQEASSDSQPKEAPAQDTPKEAPQEQKPAAKKAAGGKQTVDIKVPDLGGSDSVEIIEVAVSEGDEVNAEDTLITLESDKASMDVPSPYSGKIVSFTVKEGDTVSEGDVIGTMEIAGEGGDESEEAPEEQAASQSSSEPEASAEEDDQEEAASGEPERKEIRVPDLSGSSDVPIIEIGVAAGDEINEEDPLITLESDKASMDVPSPYKGKLIELTVKEGDTVSEGDVIGYMEVAGAKTVSKSKQAAPKKAAPEKASQSSSSQSSAKPSESPAGTPSPEAQMAAHKPRDGKLVHAGPAVRMLARELGVDLELVKPSGPKDRVLKEDVQAYVKQAIANQGKAQPGAAAATGGAGIPPIPEVDFSQFGEIGRAHV